MEFKIDSTCDKCNGIDKCNKMCILHCGKALYNFINGVDTIRTRIGEYESTKRNGSLDLVVSGHQLYDIETSSWLLTSISTALDASDKFSRAYDKNAFQIASLYCKYANINSEETKAITDKIKEINKNKLLILPFKPHTNCNIDFDYDGEKFKKQDAQISLIKWDTNKDTHKINCNISFELNNKNSGTNKITLDIKDYITKFRLSQMDIQAKGKNHDKNMIKVNDYGMFKPIYVTDNTSAVVVDGTYMYYILNDETHIIGYWDVTDKMKVTANIKTKAFTRVMDNIEYIRNHKRYIAPYLLLEANKILV